MLECKPGKCHNILTSKGLEAIEGINRIIEDEQAWSKFCLLNQNEKCMNDLSPGRITSMSSPFTIFKHYN